MLTWIDWLLVLFGFGMRETESTQVPIDQDVTQTGAAGFPVVSG